MDEPIIAIASALGQSGIGVLRASGQSLEFLITAVCRKKLLPRQATYTVFQDDREQIIDQGIALFFPAPHSYTGEDVVEFQTHGSPVVLEILLQHCLHHGRKYGLRLAQPGEFTQRAYLNHKLDLVQAEAVADLIAARSIQAAYCAARSLSGDFSKKIHSLVERTIALRALLEASLDFPEEEIDFLNPEMVSASLLEITQLLQDILVRSQKGNALRRGLTVVLTGAPNVGKSSLLNQLLAEDVAIVTSIPGTTRDRLQHMTEIEGLSFCLIDTAGLRETEDEIERLGIQKSYESIAQADCVLHLSDATQLNRSQDSKDLITCHLPSAARLLSVWNKVDLLAQLPEIPDQDTVLLSAKTGDGLECLKKRLFDIAGWSNQEEGLFFARTRHLQALQAAEENFLQAQKYCTPLWPELLSEELRLAQLALGSITGHFDSDDLLGEIFSNFCIGK